MSQSLVELADFVCLRSERALFQPINLTLGAGEALEITGANGAGKTTLLRALAGLHGQVAGSANVSSFLYHGHRIALDESLTAVRNLEWYAALGGRDLSRDALRGALAEVGALNLGLTPVGALSQGQQRRIAMARWQLDGNPVWLLDEPATALDVAGQELLCSLIAHHRQAGGAVLYSTHQPLDVADKATLELAVAA